SFGKLAEAHILCGTRRASPANVGAVISVNENLAAPCDRQLPLEPRSDRQAAHYYRSQHSRAVQREQQWKQRALTAEKLLAQLVVWVGWYGQQIEALKRQLAWLKKQQFGCKSEATRSRLGEVERFGPHDAGGSSLAAQAPNGTGVCICPNKPPITPCLRRSAPARSAASFGPPRA